MNQVERGLPDLMDLLSTGTRHRLLDRGTEFCAALRTRFDAGLAEVGRHSPLGQGEATRAPAPPLSLGILLCSKLTL